MKALRALARIAAGLAVTVPAAAAPVVVNFDDLVGEGTVADGYGGINWGGAWNYYGYAQTPYNPSSGTVRVYNADPSSFTFGSDVVFTGAFFAGVDDVDVDGVSDNFIHFELFLDGVLQFTSGNLLPTDVPTFLGSGYAGLVDEVRVLSVSGDYYVMDDVSYDNLRIPVPEPASLLLVALAGLALVGCRRRHGATVD